VASQRLPAHGKLLKLGIEVSQATVGRHLPWRPKVPSPTWRSFLHNHLTDIAAIDMFVVATATFRLLYALIVLGHDRRRIIHFDVTQNPTQVWLSRQGNRDVAFPMNKAGFSSSASIAAGGKAGSCSTVTC
jgi:putative transposase